LFILAALSRMSLDQSSPNNNVSSTNVRGDCGLPMTNNTPTVHSYVCVEGSADSTSAYIQYFDIFACFLNMTFCRNDAIFKRAVRTFLKGTTVYHHG